MTLDDSRLNILPSPPRFNSAVQKLSRLQTELMSDALRRLVDDAGAALMHQLSEPLTALLLYLHEIRRAGEADVTGFAPAALCEVVDLALRETERICSIIEQVGKSAEASVDAEAAVARGREAIDAWARNGRVRADATGSPAPRANAYQLTPREQEVLALITSGFSNKEGGYRLGISTRTFEAHRAHLMGKLGARNAADLIRKTSNQNQDV
jgi:DNA-binding CsgD family transcriptional regulator